MTTRNLILILLLWIFYLSANSQQYSLKQYTAAEGLPQSQVTSILEDSLGYLWVGTFSGGLGRFDGKEIKNYTVLDGLQSNNIIGLQLDNHNQLWVCHPQGISRFDGNRFTKFTSSSLQNNEGRLRRIFTWNDSLFYISMDGKWGHINNNRLFSRHEITDKYIKYMRIAKDRIIIVLADYSILVKDKLGLHSVNLNEQFQQTQNVILLQDSTIIKTENGFYKLDFEKWTVHPTKVPFQNDLFLFDADHKEYWTGNNNALLKESSNTQHVIDTILRETVINQVYADRQHNIWIATGGTGLYRYSIQDFERCGSPSLKLVMAIHQEKSGTSWIGTINKGLIRINKNKIDKYQFSSEGTSSIGAIKEYKGQIWVATNNGLGEYNQVTNQFKLYNEKDGLPRNDVRCLDFDENGYLWLGTGNGISRFKPGQKTANYSLKENITGKTIFCIYYDLKTKMVYAGTDFGITTIQNSKVAQLNIPILNKAKVLSIRPYRKNLILIGTDGAGGCIYNPQTGIATFINTKNGLPSDLLYFLDEDNEGFIWVGTERGINKIKLNDKNEIIENINFGSDNGLKGLETNHNAYFFGKEKYFGLVDGLYQYNESAIRNTQTNPLHLTDVQLYYGSDSSRAYANVERGFFKIPVHPIFPNNKNHITFFFNRVDKLFSNVIKYQYLLEPFDQTWSLPSSFHQVTYSNLPAGDYIFRVRAINSLGKWDDTTLEYPFKIESAFYQTIFFRVVVAIGLILGIAGIIYWRIKLRALQAIKIEQIKFHEKELLRKDLARDFHDEMGNQLTRIINYISLLKLNYNEPTAKEELYNKVEDSAKALYSGTRDFIWAIDPSNDELKKVFIHIKDFAESILKEKNIFFRADNKTNLKINLPYGSSRQILLIFKEAVTNVFEHSQAINAKLTLEQENQQFKFTLSDDGIGFQPGEIENLRGIKNMRARAERIGGILRIHHDKKENGTQISLIITKFKVSKYDISI